MRTFLLVIACSLFFFSPTSTQAQQSIPILIYHSIDEYTGQGSKELFVTPKNFEQQMTYLKDHGYTLLTFERWNEIENVDKPILITFDDGYKNNLNAYSTFQKLENSQFKPTGTIFVISDFVGRSNRLSPEDLRELANSGYFSIQSHTATHPDLTKITNYDYELKKSKEKIEQITSRPVIALSYPYGNFSNQVIEETKKYYEFGLTTTPGQFIKKGLKDELYLLPRIYIKYSTSLDEFASLVEGE
ncbi:Polysaccharide deacetylase [Mesobacillus persicus]|uniref:Polysaccharide deacetylase n=1 Tax=Mesobacillus persicus TaxID=930146 RepID=A0A1H8F3D8_9BACI|nr:polysaccharide deacetylase family protein [Mesobacillus persicus]SEN26130.1 Polysaccharide deacetylase [Mesobacillus persicus]